jgi:hypothetical protein
MSPLSPFEGFINNGSRKPVSSFTVTDCDFFITPGLLQALLITLLNHHLIVP